MRLAIIGVFVVGLLIFIISRLRSKSADKYYVDGEGNLRSADGTLVNALAPPDIVTGNPKTPGNSVSSYCTKLAGVNAAGAEKIASSKNAPPVVGQVIYKGQYWYVNQWCEAEKYAEKAIGAVIVTPAKKLYHAIF